MAKIRISYYGVWIMDQWPDTMYRAVTLRSEALFKNKHVLPVAGWIAECKADTISAADVCRGLGGRVAPNKVLEVLVRLTQGGVLLELPFPGRPHPRLFQPRLSSFWEAAAEFASEARGIEPKISRNA